MLLLTLIVPHCHLSSGRRTTENGSHTVEKLFSNNTESLWNIKTELRRQRRKIMLICISICHTIQEKIYKNLSLPESKNTHVKLYIFNVSCKQFLNLWFYDKSETTVLKLLKAGKLIHTPTLYNTLPEKFLLAPPPNPVLCKLCGTNDCYGNTTLTLGQMKTWLLVLSWPRACCGNQLGSEPLHWRSLSVCVYLFL